MIKILRNVENAEFLILGKRVAQSVALGNGWFSISNIYWSHR